MKRTLINYWWLLETWGRWIQLNNSWLLFQIVATQGKKTDALLEFSTNHRIDIHHCHGQSYDTTPDMSCKYKGMQARILKKNNDAVYIPCMEHSSNLIGNVAANACPNAEFLFQFFGRAFRVCSTRYKYLIVSNTWVKLAGHFVLMVLKLLKLYLFLSERHC